MAVPGPFTHEVDLGGPAGNPRRRVDLVLTTGNCFADHPVSVYVRADHEASALEAATAHLREQYQGARIVPARSYTACDCGAPHDPQLDAVPAAGRGAEE